MLVCILMLVVVVFLPQIASKTKGIWSQQEQEQVSENEAVAAPTEAETTPSWKVPAIVGGGIILLLVMGLCTNFGRGRRTGYRRWKERIIPK